MEWSFGGSSFKYVSNNMPTTYNKYFTFFVCKKRLKIPKR